MKKEQGAALVWLLYIMFLFSLLGVSLLKLAVVNLRISGHLVAAEQAQYAAEAGVALAEAVLSSLWQQQSFTEWRYEHAEEPAFSVSISQQEGAFRICAQGEAKHLTQSVEVLASVRPVGEQALYAQKIELAAAEIQGHLNAGEVVFSHGESLIIGDLRTNSLTVEEGGAYNCTGKIMIVTKPYDLKINFADLQEKAFYHGWHVPALVDGLYLVDGLQVGPIYAPALTKIALKVPWEGMIVAAGDVIISEWASGSQVVVIAAGDVILDSAVGFWPGSLFIYSAGRISRSNAALLEINGCLLAPLIQIHNLSISYSDIALLQQQSVVPRELLLADPSFTLEWLELVPRR
ncbi:MAG: hypothetical protein GX922_04295 [Firmicutes bacterium]|nr:hypothetical protein [Bacillota bacterium]